MWTSTGFRAVCALLSVIPLWGTTADLRAQRPTFTATTRLVTVAVSVRDEKGRPVTGLTAKDFEVRSNETARPISAFYSDPSPVTIAFLFDGSGSMAMGHRLTAARQAAGDILSEMRAGSDRAGVFAFDESFWPLHPFGPVGPDTLSALAGRPAFGQTSLYDALAASGSALADDGAPRRAIVAFTDGRDTSSRLSPQAVSGQAAAIDVPLYIVALRSGLDTVDPSLASLAEWTGGTLLVARSQTQAREAGRTILTDLRQHYLIGFVPDTRPGWHRLSVRTRSPRHLVRARAGYVVSPVS